MKKILPALLFLAAAMAAAMPAMGRMFGGGAGAVFEGADTDHDGRISRAEFAAARDRQFDRLDRNHDGVVSRDDFSRLMRFRPEAGARLDRWIAAADANHDGKVTRAELHAAPMRMFDLADTNHDGFVDQAELAAFRDRIKTLKEDGGP